MKTNYNLCNNYVTLLAVILISFFSTQISLAQCAGTDNSITICDKEVYDQGLGNPIGTVNLFTLLGGTPVAGGTWNDDNSTGGLNTTNGLLDTWTINQGGVFNYTYTANPTCAIPTAVITVTLGGFPGTSTASAVACDNEAAHNLFQHLSSGPSATLGGTWSDDDSTGALSGQFFDATAIATGTPYDFTHTIPAVGSCPARSATVTITVFPTPDAGTPTDLTLCETDDMTPYIALDLFTQLTGHDLGGTWTDTSIPVTGELTGGLDSIINLQNINTTFGSGTYTFQYTVNPSNPICIPQTSTVTIIIEPVVDLNGSTLSVSPTPICLADLATTSFTATITQGVVPIPDGMLDITYVTSPPPNSGTETVSVTFTGGVGNWTINPAFLTAEGIITIAVTNVVDPATTTNCQRVITNLNTTFEIVAEPDVSDTQVIVDDVCIGNDGLATISDIGAIGGIQLADGTYTITYTITPTGTSFTTTIVITAGIGTFTIPTAQIPTEGGYSIDIISWQNAAGCTTTASITDTFTVNPLPDAQNINVTIADVCDDGNTDLTIVITDSSSPITLIDGTYDIMYDIVGPPDLLGQTELGLVFTGGVGTFTIPAGTFPIGAYSFTITNLVNANTTCDTTTFTNPGTTFNIYEIPNAGDVVLTIADICLNNDAIVTFSDANPGTAPELLDGTYDIIYNLSGANVSTGNTGNITITSTNGTFTIPAGLLTNAGTTNVSITSLINTATGCAAIGIPIFTTFQVNPIPDIDNATITVSQPICIGDDGTVTISGTTLANGNYDITYNLTGDNISAGNTTTVTFAGGSTSFILSGVTQIPNAGTTTIEITTITDLNTPLSCANTVSNVSTSFVVSPIPTLNVSSLEVPEQDSCLGADKDIDILGSTIADGVYTITYNVSNPASTGNTATLAITSGTGSGIFTIPASLLTNLGNVVITITAIVNDATGCGTTGLNVQTNFNVIDVPDATGATLTVSNECFNTTTEPIVTITGATGLPDGDYTITYSLSGANSATDETVTTTFTSGGTSFNIPLALLVNDGTTTITISNILYNVTMCPANNLAIPPVSFNLINPTSPSLVNAGITYCFNNNPTLNTLLANISNPLTHTITWYDAATGGTIYTDLNVILNHGQTYYVTFNDGMCESATTAITVDLTNCDTILIPDAFSPNGDGQNDTYTIQHIDFLYPKHTLEIYNRYGNIVYKGDINTPDFSGKSNQGKFLSNDILPVGVYFYIIEFNDDTTKPKQGRLYLSR